MAERPSLAAPKISEGGLLLIASNGHELPVEVRALLRDLVREITGLVGGSRTR